MSAMEGVWRANDEFAGSATGELVSFLLTREVAELLRAPESTVRYWRHTGVGPPSVKVGRRVLYRRAAVPVWVATRERGTLADSAPLVTASMIAARVRPRTDIRRGRGR